MLVFWNFPYALNRWSLKLTRTTLRQNEILMLLLITLNKFKPSIYLNFLNGIRVFSSKLISSINVTENTCFFLENFLSIMACRNLLIWTFIYEYLTLITIWIPFSNLILRWFNFSLKVEKIEAIAKMCYSCSEKSLKINTKTPPIKALF